MEDAVCSSALRRDVVVLALVALVALADPVLAARALWGLVEGLAVLALLLVRVVERAHCRSLLVAVRVLVVVVEVTLGN